MISQMTLAAKEWSNTHITILIFNRRANATLNCFISEGISKIFNKEKRTFYSYRGKGITLIQRCIDEYKNNTIFWQSNSMNFLRGFPYLE